MTRGEGGRLLLPSAGLSPAILRQFAWRTNAELRNSIAVIKLVGQQLELQEYVRIDGDAPLITRVLGFVAMADERTRRETMAAFTARGESPYTIEDAVMRLYRRGLVKRTRRGVVEAVHEKAWTAIKEKWPGGCRA